MLSFDQPFDNNLVIQLMLSKEDSQMPVCQFVAVSISSLMKLLMLTFVTGVSDVYVVTVLASAPLCF